MNVVPSPAAHRPFSRTRKLFLLWIAIWILMLLLGVQESLWSGSQHLWQPVVDYATAAIPATLLVILQARRGRRYDHLLQQPMSWFLHMWRWMPAQALAYFTLMYGLRLGIYALLGQPLRHAPWGELLAYEGVKFLLFFGLFSGVHFGLRSYRAWVEERLRSAQQANLARRTQLMQLTQQLQPHFLFNTLNTISSLIHTDPDAADHTLTRLATLLRTTTDVSQRPEQTLGEEIELLRAYTDIMTQRFSDRVEIDWNIDPAASTCLVPTLCLQPLVENCFRHVVEQRSAMTRICITAVRNGPTLLMTVEDDGPATALPQRYGVGLGNLQSRLSARDEPGARLELALRRPAGLCVMVSLPCAS